MKKRLVSMVALILVLAMVLAGCGGGGSGTQGDVHILRVGWTSEPDILNPLTTYSTEANQIIWLVYQPLIGYDENLETINYLAEDYEYSEDGLVATYHLREGVKWHDGEPFTAQDVVTTYRIAMDYKIGPASSFIDGLTDVVAVDDYTVEMHFNKRVAYNIAYTTPIIPDHIWGDMSAEDIEVFANENPVGTGPMKFVQWDQGSTVILDKNPDYYGEEPGPDRIAFIQYGNEDVMAQALKAGEVDIVCEISPTVWDGLVDVENVKAVSLPSFSFHEVGINVNESESSGGSKLLLDKTLRQALSYAMDREQIVEVALAGHGTPGTTLIPAGMSEWQYEVTEDEKMDADLDKANAMLDEAGYLDTDGDGIREKDGEPLEFRIFAIESTTVDVRAAQIFRDSCEQIGIKLVLTTMDENTMGGVIFDTAATDFDLFVWGWDSDYLDPGYLLSIPLTSEIGRNNDIYYSNSTYDALYEQQHAEMDPEKRLEIVQEMQKIFYEDAAYLVLWNQDKLQAYRTDTWTGWTDTPGGIVFNVTYENYVNVQPVQ